MHPPSGQAAKEAWLIVGRRGGKSKVAFVARISRTDADREQSRRLLARYLEFAVPLMGFVDELETLSTN